MVIFRSAPVRHDIEGQQNQCVSHGWVRALLGRFCWILSYLVYVIEHLGRLKIIKHHSSIILPKKKGKKKEEKKTLVEEILFQIPVYQIYIYKEIW